MNTVSDSEVLDLIKGIMRSAAKGERAQAVMAAFINSEVILVSIAAQIVQPEFVGLINEMDQVRTLSQSPTPKQAN
jgi:hypothetical protein